MKLPHFFVTRKWSSLEIIRMLFICLTLMEILLTSLFKRTFYPPFWTNDLASLSFHSTHFQGFGFGFTRQFMQHFVCDAESCAATCPRRKASPRRVIARHTSRRRRLHGHSKCALFTQKRKMDEFRLKRRSTALFCLFVLNCFLLWTLHLTVINLCSFTCIFIPSFISSSIHL